MKRDRAGKFTQAWDGEPKQAVKLSLTNTAWRLLEQQAKEAGVSRSELIERYARHAQCQCCGERKMALDREILDYSAPEILMSEDPRSRSALLAEQTALRHHNKQLQNQIADLQRQVEGMRSPEQLQQQADAQMSAQWLEAVLNLLPTPLILVDPTAARVTFSNQAANAIAGVDIAKDVGATYNSDYYCTDPYGQVIPVEQLPAVRVVRGEKIIGAELNWHTPVGVFPLLVYADTVPAMHGHTATSVVVFQDIQARKQAELISIQLVETEQAARAQAEASEQRFRSLAEAIPQIVWVAQANGCTEYYNQRWFQYTGLTFDESQNANGSFRHPDDHDRFKSAWSEAVTNKEVLQVEQRLRRADGIYRWHLTRAYPQLDENSEIVKWFGSCTDIDDWKQIEQKQRILAQASHTFVAASLDLQTILDTLTRLVSELSGDVCVLNLLADDRELLDHVSFYHPDPEVCSFVEDLLERYPRRVNEGISGQVMQTGKPLLMPVSSQAEFGAVIKPEYRLYLERFQVCSTLLVPLRVQGESIGVLSLTRHAPAHPHTEDDLHLFQDLADRAAMAIVNAQLYEAEQRARAQAEAANRTKDEFLAVLSHELRTPMNPILGWARLLKRGNLNVNKIALAVDTIERNAQLQVQLIEDLLDVSRILQGKLSLTPSPVNLTSVIEAAVSTIRLSAEAKAIDVKYTILEPETKETGNPNSQIVRLSAHAEVQTPKFQVLGDAARLQQVVWNLLSNAVKFTPAGGQIEVRVEQVERGSIKDDPRPIPLSLHPPIHAYAQITVTDTGKGIRPEFLPFVFDTFRQADSSITRTFGGLGLGLAIARNIVELHHGTIQVTSAGEGQGATFTVTLPLLPTATVAESKPTVGDDPLTLQNIQVLTVDDEIDNLELVTFLLEQAGASVVAVNSAADALQALKQTKPNVLLLDIGMPELDGYTLLRKIRALEAEHGNQPVPAIALTAYAGEVNQQQALAAGFQQHIPKPLEPKVLLQAIIRLAAS